ncbi:complement C1q and tumor necrosis factor-related protein 9-like [Cololabis saira]|uniref:complement C1q and tumor necrosis factor-related protein 9-like n=1 Tax=Cololabis saira TaxID=129043 RepID=UPI002AD59126|nr:complement C1q and tumor necrosis factor-related protein 9-like [Cololabis saira]
MRAIVLVCLLRAAFAKETSPYRWEPTTQPPLGPRSDQSACTAGPEACGCCLMQKHINRMEHFFNFTVLEMRQELIKTKMGLNNMRASRSAFSVALNDDEGLTCFGPFPNNKLMHNDTLIPYKHVFINLGDSYDAQTGIFTVPRSGVYSFAVTIYSYTARAQKACANLQVNGRAVAELTERNGEDSEDSNSVVAAVQLEAGDWVAVGLLRGCDLCDNSKHFNTFTGFLLYATDTERRA